MVKATVAQVVVEFAEQRHGKRCRCLLVHHQTAIGQTGMRLEHVSFPVGRHQGIEPPFTVEHQRTVLEAVAVIVHIVTVEEERAVLRPGYEAVPLGLAFGGVSDYIKHLYRVNCRNSS